MLTLIGNSDVLASVNAFAGETVGLEHLREEDSLETAASAVHFAVDPMQEERRYALRLYSVRASNLSRDKH